MEREDREQDPNELDDDELEAELTDAAVDEQRSARFEVLLAELDRRRADLRD